MSDEVYYRLYLNRDMLHTVVCMQYFDEIDYTEHKFVKKPDGERYKFDTEAEAISVLNELFDPQEIVDEYVAPRPRRKGHENA